MAKRKHLWEVQHPYYCHSENYYKFGIGNMWDSFQEFLEYWDNLDLDYNMLFRWDWEVVEDSEVDLLRLYYMLQRKGIFLSHTVKVKKSDEEAVIEFLKPRLEYMKKLWEPLGEYNE